ncbi:hypothetical protein EJ02DRAFT_466234 [Clathrospora elynae]|uniref:C2H2-type domain-containing protein n=1 Tax=Clathrospora elynae TaxID=706981 RepID=A0A6A5SMA6_9PLEO|nr:hypothetical protein EJ02DRAFT_466234 [Clathrospora elynae]
MGEFIPFVSDENDVRWIPPPYASSDEAHVGRGLTIPATLNIFGMTGGSDTAMTPAPLMSRNSSQLSNYPHASTFNQGYMGREPNNDHTMVNRIAAFPTSEMDHDAYETHQKAHNFRERSLDTTAAYDTTTRGDFGAQYSYSGTPDGEQTSWLHQLDLVTLSPLSPVVVLAGLEDTRPAPWSAFTARDVSLGQHNHFSAPTGYDETRDDEIYSSEYSYYGQSASNGMDTMTSQTSFEASEMMDSQSTLRPPNSGNGKSHSRRRGSSTSNGSLFANLYASTRGSTAGPALVNIRHVTQSGYLSRSSSHSHRLPVHNDTTSAFGSPSPALPYENSTPTGTDNTFLCGIGRCSQGFTGVYGSGNRQRHWRLKHGPSQGTEETAYPCEHPGCVKSYKRQDARLKHYRKQHAYLAPGKPRSRKQCPSM